MVGNRDRDTLIINHLEREKRGNLALEGGRGIENGEYSIVGFGYLYREMRMESVGWWGRGSKYSL